MVRIKKKQNNSPRSKARFGVLFVVLTITASLIAVTLGWRADAQSTASVDIKVNGSNTPSPITTGTSYTISWSSVGVTPNGRCYMPVATSNWGLAWPAPGSGSVTKTAPAAGTYNYGIYCSDNNGVFAPGNPDTLCNQSSTCDLIQVTFVNPPTPPPSTPPPSTTPPSTPPSTGGGTSSGSSSSTTTTKKTTTSSSSTPAAQPVKVPPGAPSNFSASANPGEVGVNLSWNAPAITSNINGYNIDRSSDGGQSWEMVSASIQATNYVDTAVNFDTQYNYRLASVGTAGDLSDYVYAQAKTSSFVPNSRPDSDITLHSDDNIVSVTIAAGALENEAVCSIELNIQLGDSPNVAQYVLAAGPYTVICKNQDGSTVTGFAKPLQVTVDTSSFKKKYTALAYYSRPGQGTNWTGATSVIHDTKGHTDSFELATDNVLAIMGKPKHTAAWLKIFLWLVLLIVGGGLIIGGGYLFLRYTSQQRLQSQYDDYYRKSQGY